MSFLSIFNKEEKEENLISVLKDPFFKDKIEKIFISIYPKENRFYASVRCVNGDTEGEQNFRANSYPELMNKLEIFIKSLEK